MLEYNLDLSFIEQNTNLDSGELIVLGGRPGMGKTSFIMNLLSNSSRKVCFISLSESSEEIAYKKERMNIYPDSKKNYDTICIDRPPLIELLELIVAQKGNFQYFVIDDLRSLEEDVNPLFSEHKNYQLVLRHLKVLAKSLHTNIILVSLLDKRVEDGFPFRFYSSKEKYIDHLLIIHRPACYPIQINKFNDPIEYDDAFLYITKTKLLKDCDDFRLKFKYPLWYFPGGKYLDKNENNIVPF